ncbi:MAG: Dabb family protein [Flavobacteriaceae bacterium]
MKQIIIIFFAAMTTQFGFSQDVTTANDFDPNFVHSVYFWLKNPDNATDRQDFETALRKLLKKSKYTKTNYIGTAPKAIRDVVDDSFTYNLLVTFESAEAQEAYQVEDVHLQFIEEANHLWEKVVVYDAVGLSD